MSGAQWKESDRKLIVAILDFMYTLKLKIGYVVRQSSTNSKDKGKKKAKNNYIETSEP